MLSRSIVKIFFFATILLLIVVTAAVAAPVDQTATNSVGSIHTYLMPDLSLKSAFVGSISALPGGAGIRKTCRCSCGTAPCASDADCGGGVGSCSHFISCCAKGEGAQFVSDQSSRQTELPAVKAGCN